MWILGLEDRVKFPRVGSPLTLLGPDAKRSG